MGDAHLRRALRRPALERALPPQPRQGPDRALGRLRPADPDRLRPRPRRSPAARSARSASRSPTRATCTRCFDGIPLDEMNTSMTINATAAWLLALYVTVAEENGRRARGAHGHDPERHHQGVPLARHLRLPARAVDAADRRHGRVHRQRDPELEPDQRLHLPPPGGRRDPGPGDRLRALDRDRGARRGQGARPGLRGGLPQGLRPDLVLRQRRRPLRRGAREAARDGGDLGADRPRALRGRPSRSSCACATASRSTRSG